MRKEGDYKEFYPLTNDAIFKMFFGRQENIHLLRDFLLSNTNLRPEDMIEIQLEETRLEKFHVVDKDFIVDIKLTNARGEQIHLEMQMQWHEGFFDRIVADNSRQLNNQLNTGQNYPELKSSISVVITNFRAFHDSDEFSELVMLRRQNKKTFTSIMQIYILDLTKVDERLTENAWLWAKLLNATTVEEVEILMKESDLMREAGVKLIKMSEDDEARALAEAREMSQWAWQHTLYRTEKNAEARGEIKAMIELLAEMGYAEGDILNRVIIKHNLSQSEAKEYMSHYYQSTLDFHK